MGMELFYPAPSGLPDPVNPRAAEPDIRRRVEETDWRDLAQLEDDRLVRAGALWLHGHLEPAHRIVQEIASPEGSYWHALVHRSEGDYHNSLYWFAHMGTHSIFAELRRRTEEMLQERAGTESEEDSRSLLLDKEWNPRRFVELCRLAREGHYHNRPLLQRIAAEEYNLLMSYLLGL